MNNAVSADVTLFSRVHPDIVKRISVSSVIVSALLAIGGIGAFVTSLRMGDATSTMSMVFMTVGTILILTALFRLFWRSKEWVYTPTGSVTKEGSCFFDVCDLHVLTARLDKKTFGSQTVTFGWIISFLMIRDLRLSSYSVSSLIRMKQHLPCTI